MPLGCLLLSDRWACCRRIVLIIARESVQVGLQVYHTHLRQTTGGSHLSLLQLRAPVPSFFYSLEPVTPRVPQALDP
eukprot:754219-Hanusia_phi.AAC.1